jgi:hypothetical protein
LEGIEILSQQVQIINSTLFPELEIFLLVMLCIITFIIGICLFHDEELCSIIIFTISLIFVMLIAIGSQKQNIKTDKFIYKVTIDDNINFNEFNRKYEIINQDGKIYTIIEK